MGKLWGHIKNIGPWLLGLVAGFFVWLRFIHDPKVAKNARRKLKLKELDKRRKNLEEEEVDTRRSEEKLNKKRRKLKEKLDEDVASTDDVDRTVDRMSSRFGWSDEGGGG